MREDDIWVGAPHGSEAAYAHAKRAMLAQLEAYRDRYGMQFAFCISTNLFGPHDCFDECNGHVLPSLLSKFERGLRTGGAVEVWGSGRARSDFLHSADAARALRLIGEHGVGPINVASGTSVTIAEAVNILVNVTGFRRPIQWDRSKPDGQLVRDYDVSRLRSLGFTPAFSFEEGVRRSFAWLRTNFHKARCSQTPD